jgi:5-methylcytosine-specific restriction protein A
VTWDTSDRRERLPDNWPALRGATKKRARATSKLGYAQCEARLPSGKRCPREGTDCDHVIPGDDHRLANLRWLCGFHHDKKSAAEGRAAQAAKKASRYRPREEHPGTLS